MSIVVSLVMALQKAETCSQSGKVVFVGIKSVFIRFFPLYIMYNTPLRTFWDRVPATFCFMVTYWIYYVLCVQRQIYLTLSKHPMHYFTRAHVYVAASVAFSTAECVLPFWTDIYVLLNVISGFIVRRFQLIVHFCTICKITVSFRQTPSNCFSNTTAFKERKYRNGLIIYTLIGLLNGALNAASVPEVIQRLMARQLANNELGKDVKESCRSLILRWSVGVYLN
jgi:hypothetical protein